MRSAPRAFQAELEAFLGAMAGFECGKRGAPADADDCAASKRPRGAEGPGGAPAPGTRVAVRWVVETDGDAPEGGAGAEDAPAAQRFHWWGATVGDAEGDAAGDAAARTLRYDAFGAFAATTAPVRFPEAKPAGECGTLFDCEVRDQLAWRLEDETCEPADDNGDDGVTSLRQLVQDQDDVDQEAGDGQTVLGLGMQAMSELPMTQQQRFAAGYRIMADRLKDALSELVTKNGEGYVVTAEDMHSIIAELRGD